MDGLSTCHLLVAVMHSTSITITTYFTRLQLKANGVMTQIQKTQTNKKCDTSLDGPKKLLEKLCLQLEIQGRISSDVTNWLQNLDYPPNTQI